MNEESLLGRIANGYNRIHDFVYRTIQPDSDAEGTKCTVFFDAVIMLLIGASVAIVFAVTFDLPPGVMDVLKKTEMAIVFVFTGEYFLRFWTANRRYKPKGDASFFSRSILSRLRYVVSVMAIVDLLAILPSYLPYLLPEGMLGIRALRLIRLLRIFKVTQHSRTLSAIADVIRDKAKDLLAVLFFMSLMVLFLSLLMYAAEHDAQPDKFENAISALWWAVETFTKSGTRGFYPVTTLGRIIGAVISVLGICLIAIPTGIISSGLVEHLKNRKPTSGDGDKKERPADDVDGARIPEPEKDDPERRIADDT